SRPTATTRCASACRFTPCSAIARFRWILARPVRMARTASMRCCMDPYLERPSAGSRWGLAAIGATAVLLAATTFAHAQQGEDLREAAQNPIVANMSALGRKADIRD